MKLADPAPEGPAAPGAALCLACGFCCSGLLYGNVAIEPPEVERVRRRGLPIVAEGRRAKLDQPCVAHDGRLCTVYEDRPAACRAYACQLLERHLRGELTLDESIARVTAVRAMVARIALRAGISTPGPFWAALDALLAQQPDASALHWRRANADLLLDIAELRLALGRELDASFDPRVGVPTRASL